MKTSNVCEARSLSTTEGVLFLFDQLLLLVQRLYFIGLEIPRSQGREAAESRTVARARTVARTRPLASGLGVRRSLSILPCQAILLVGLVFHVHKTNISTQKISELVRSSWGGGAKSESHARPPDESDLHVL